MGVGRNRCRGILTPFSAKVITMRKALIILAAFFCAACSNYSANLPSIKPYKMDIQQGNHVTSKMMMQLRPGMTKSQVRFVMGTPLIADSFHADRWDYLYRMVKGGKLIEQRHVILEFENDQLKRVRGDVIPAGTGDAAVAEPVDKNQPRSIAPKQKEKGLMDKLKFWKSDEEPVKPASEKGPLTAPARVVEPAAAPAPKTVAPESVADEPRQPAAEPAKPEPAKSEPVKQPAAKPVAPEPRVAPAKVDPVKAEPAKVEPKAAPVPADDLPPEDDPGYFERMLEKIGF